MILVYQFQLGIALSHEHLFIVVIVQLILFTVVQVVEQDSCHSKHNVYACEVNEFTIVFTQCINHNDKPFFYFQCQYTGSVVSGFVFPYKVQM